MWREPLLLECLELQNWISEWAGTARARQMCSKKVDDVIFATAFWPDVSLFQASGRLLLRASDQIGEVAVRFYHRSSALPEDIRQSRVEFARARE